MRGARCKALKAKFKRLNGRAPHKTFWTGGRYFEHIPSEWRHLKRGWKRGGAER